MQWNNGYFDVMFGNDWELGKSAAGAHQWHPKNGTVNVLDAHDANRSHLPMMTAADLALRADPAYESIARRFHQNPINLLTR